jgi:autoinducer 2-degrading protein
MAVVTSVNIYVKEESIEDFIRETMKNVEGSRREPGNIRFDFLQAGDNPTRFMLYEVFDSSDSVDIHKQTAHYLGWRDAVADMMKMPRQGVPFIPLAPKNNPDWKS